MQKYRLEPGNEQESAYMDNFLDEQKNKMKS
jgi:hypothetical protein